MSKKVNSLMSNRRVKFWKDKWCNDVDLCYSFPLLYVLANSKKVCSGDLGFFEWGRIDEILLSFGHLMIEKWDWWSDSL